MESPINTPNPPVVDPEERVPILAACANCVFFHRVTEAENNGPARGECREHEPTADSRGGAQWPGVHEGLWCGKHPTLQVFIGKRLEVPLPENGVIVCGLRPVQPTPEAPEEVEEGGATEDAT